mmetsp:Transcript_2180/g.5399  ORF Transcript_2180/g.5399 Transcript_2180/m.5399 type:complete len:253 (+) Transcript_2180:138-896(+)
MDETPSLSEYVAGLKKREQEVEAKREAKRRKKEESRETIRQTAEEERAGAPKAAAPEAAAAPPATAQATASTPAGSGYAASPAYSGPPRIPEPPDIVMAPCFDVVKGGAVVERLSLDKKASWTFGRQADVVDFNVNHESCSRQHATVSLQQGQFVIADLGSAHGTVVDGRKLVKNVQVRLSSGANVRFGASTRVYIFRLPRCSTAMLQQVALQQARSRLQGNGAAGAGASAGSGRFRYRSTLGGALNDFSDS